MGARDQVYSHKRTRPAASSSLGSYFTAVATVEALCASAGSGLSLSSLKSLVLVGAVGPSANWHERVRLGTTLAGRGSTLCFWKLQVENEEREGLENLAAHRVHAALPMRERHPLRARARMHKPPRAAASAMRGGQSEEPGHGPTRRPERLPSLEHSFGMHAPKRDTTNLAFSEIHLP